MKNEQNFFVYFDLETPSGQEILPPISDIQVGKKNK